VAAAAAAQAIPDVAAAVPAVPSSSSTVQSKYSDPLTAFVAERIGMVITQQLPFPPQQQQQTTVVKPTKKKQLKPRETLQQQQASAWAACPYRDCETFFKAVTQCEEHLGMFHLRQEMQAMLPNTSAYD
jgi:hypothetical protein